METYLIYNHADDRLYLAHHGIKGMHWGIRRFQAYGEGGYIRKKGATGLELLGAGGGGGDPLELPEPVGGGGGGEPLEELEGDSSLKDPEIIDPNEDLAADILDPNFDQDNPDARRKSEEEHKKSDLSELVDFGKKLFKDDLEVNRLELFKDKIRLGEAALAEVKTFLNDRRISELDESDKENAELKIKDRHWTEEEDMAAVNPSYRNFDANTKSNCMLCTTTYDLRRRGYDVTAEKASSGYFNEEVRRWYPDAKIKKSYAPSTKAEAIDSIMKARSGENVKCYNETVNALKKQPDGARGNLMVTWGVGGGHSMVYEVKERKVVIRDCQTNKVYKEGSKEMQQLLGSCCRSTYARLDNVAVDKKAISEVVKG